MSDAKDNRFYREKPPTHSTTSSTPSGDLLIEKLEAKWKPSAIQIGSPLVRLDEVIETIREHQTDLLTTPALTISPEHVRKVERLGAIELPPHDLSYEEQLALVESMMTCYDTPLTQAAGYTRDLLKTIIRLKSGGNIEEVQAPKETCASSEASSAGSSPASSTTETLNPKPALYDIVEFYGCFVGTVWRIEEDGTYLVQDTCYNNPPDEEKHYEAMTECRLEDIDRIIERHGEKREILMAFQDRVAPWMQECFGPVISADRVERNHRFLEEALELVQACGCSRHNAMQLVEYVYGRPIGEPIQEVGGVMVTLAALCLARGLNMHAAGETELARILQPEIVEKIRRKQATKPQGSPLPQAASRDEVKFARADIDKLPCVESGEQFFAALIASVAIDENSFPLIGKGRRNFNIESYVAPSIQARILHKLGSGPIGGYFVIQDDFNRSRLITWDATKTESSSVDLKAGVNAIKRVFDLSLVGPDSGFKPEDVAEAVAKAWGLEVRCA